MNQRPAGPSGLSIRYTADMVMTWPSGGSSSTRISTSAPLAEPCAQEVMLGREIAKTPYSRGQQPESAGLPHVGMISVHELNMLDKDAHWNRLAV
jgi:hypothetical protein